MRIDPSTRVANEDIPKNVPAPISRGSATPVGEERAPNNDKDLGLPKKPEELVKTFENKLKRLKKIFKTELEFSVDKDTNIIVVKIKDTETGEIIRQIPPDVVVKLAKAIDEFFGLLFDERV